MERWNNTGAENKDWELGFIWGVCFGHVLLVLKLHSWQAHREGAAMAFSFNNERFSARWNLFQISLQSKVVWHKQLPQCMPGEMLLGQGAEPEGRKLAHIYTGWTTLLKVITLAATISFLSSENSFCRTQPRSHSSSQCSRHCSRQLTFHHEAHLCTTMCAAHPAELTLLGEHLLNV